MALQPVRPDPDELLKNLQAGGRGRMKIFLGYAASVGKTYAMLEAAYQRKAQGIDVVVGYIETHKRVETEELCTNSRQGFFQSLNFFKAIVVCRSYTDHAAAFLHTQSLADIDGVVVSIPHINAFLCQFFRDQSRMHVF